MVNKSIMANNNHEVLQPQEVEVFYIIPTIRSYLTKHLKQRGMKQKHIANLLGIKESTVSQYVKSKRASKIKFSRPVEKRIAESANKINTRLDAIRETQGIVKFIRNSAEICNIHRLLCNLPKDCTTSHTGCAM